MLIDRGMTTEECGTIGYYSTIKNNEIMPFVATWMDLEIVILSEESQTKTNTV